MVKHAFSEHTADDRCIVERSTAVLDYIRSRRARIVAVAAA
jgi:hypothetical protein